MTMENEEVKLNNMDQIMLFIEEYKVELLKIAVKNLDSRQKNLYELIKEENLYEITAAKAKYIVEKLIPILKEQFADYHQKSANLIKIIDLHVKRITSNPAYKLVLQKINPNDKNIFLKYISQKHSLDHEKLKYMITKINPIILANLKKLTPKEQKVVEINQLVSKNGTEILAKLSNKEYEIYKQIKNGDIKLLTEEEIDIIYKALTTRELKKYSKRETYIIELQEFQKKYKEDANQITHLLEPQDSFTYNRIMSQNIEEIPDNQLEYMIITIIPKIKELIIQKKKEDKELEKKLNAEIQTFIDKNIEDIKEVLPLLSESKRNIIVGYLENNIDIYLDDLKLIKEEIIPELTCLIESNLNNPNIETKKEYIKRIMAVKIKYDYELKTTSFNDDKYQKLINKLKKETLDELSLSELKIICDTVLPLLVSSLDKMFNERQSLYDEIIAEYEQLIKEEYFLYIRRSLNQPDIELIDKINDKKNSITTQEMHKIKELLKEIIIKNNNLKERDEYILKINKLLEQNQDKINHLGKIDLETYERLQTNPKVLIKDQVKRLYEALDNIINPKVNNNKEDNNKNKIVQRAETKDSLITREEKKGISKETTIKAISFISEKEQIILRKRYGENYDTYINDAKLTKIEINSLNRRILPKIETYSQLILSKTADDEIKQIEIQSHKKGRKKSTNNITISRTNRQNQNNTLAKASSIYELKRFKKFKKETVDQALKVLNNNKLNQLLDKRFNQKINLTTEETKYLGSSAFLSLERECDRIEPGIITKKSSKYSSIKKEKQRSLKNLTILKLYDEELIKKAIETLTEEEQELIKRYENNETLTKAERANIYKISHKIANYCKMENPTLTSYINVHPKKIKYVLNNLTSNDRSFYKLYKTRHLSEFSKEELDYINNSLIPNINKILKNSNKEITIASTLLETVKINEIEWNIVKEGMNYLTNEENELLVERYGLNYDLPKWPKGTSKKEKENKTYYLHITIKKLIKICNLIKENKSKEEIIQIINTKDYKKRGRIQKDIYEHFNTYPKIYIRIVLEGLDSETRTLLEQPDNNTALTKKEKGIKARAKKRINEEIKLLKERISVLDETLLTNSNTTKEIITKLKANPEDIEIDSLSDNQIKDLYNILSKKENDLYSFKHLQRFSKELINTIIDTSLSIKEKEIVNKYINNESLTHQELIKLHSIVLKIENRCQKNDPTNIFKQQKLNKLINTKTQKFASLSQEKRALLIKYQDSIIENIPVEEQEIILKTIYPELMQQTKEKNLTLYEYQKKYGFSKEITDEALNYISDSYKQTLEIAFGATFDQPKQIPAEKIKKKYLENALNRLKIISQKIINGEKIGKKRGTQKSLRTRKKIIELLNISNEQYQIIISDLTDEEKTLIDKNDNNELITTNEQIEKTKLVAKLRRIINKNSKNRKTKKKVKNSEEINQEYIESIHDIINNTKLNELIIQIINSNTVAEKNEILADNIFRLVNPTIVNILKETKTKQDILVFLLITNQVPNYEISIPELACMFNITIKSIKEIITDCMNIIINNATKELQSKLILKKENES